MLTDLEIIHKNEVVNSLGLKSYIHEKNVVNLRLKLKS